MLARDEDILKAAEDWRKQGRGVALATVVETWGSAPRPVGANLVIDDEGNFLGSVSGGCVEGAVVTEAIDVIGSGKPKTLEFGVADETAWKVGAVLRRHHPGLCREGGVSALAARRFSPRSMPNAPRGARLGRDRNRKAASSGWSKARTVAARSAKGRAAKSICAAARAAWRKRRTARCSSPCMCRRRGSSSPAPCISARRWRRWRGCSVTT